MKLTHPNASGPIEVDPDHADRYLSQGWSEPATTTTTDRASGKSGTTAPHTTTKKEKGE